MSQGDRHSGNVILLRVACITLLIALVEAWCLVGTHVMQLPTAFLIEAVLPGVHHPAIGLFIMTSITLTTIGFGLAAIKIFRSSFKIVLP